MADLTGRQADALQKAILSAFNFAELQQMVLHELDEELQQIALDGDLGQRVFDLINWAERRGRTSELVAGAVNKNAGNPILKEYIKRHKNSIQRGVGHHELEKIVQQNQTFKKARRWRNRLERIERQVCRIERSGNAVGSGFLVAPNVVMTNHHVVANEINGAKPTKLTTRFDYHLKLDLDHPEEGRPSLLAKEWLIDKSPHDPVDTLPMPKAYEPDREHLDYALLRLRDRVAEDQVGGDARDYLQLPEDATELAANGAVFIVQHPGGDAMSLALNTQSIVEVNDQKTRVRHKTNTEPGSSGSPCFDSDWNLIALHHSGDPETIRPEFNEGIPIQTIREELTAGVRQAIDWD